MPRTTCRRCGAPLDAQGYCTRKAVWCPYRDRLQAGSPPGPRKYVIARGKYAISRAPLVVDLASA